MRRTPLTYEQAEALAVGSALVGVDVASGGIRNGDICIKIESTGNGETILVRKVGEVLAGAGPTRAYYPSRFSKWELEGSWDLAVTNLNPAQSLALKELALSKGWCWASEGDQAAHLESSLLAFSAGSSMYIPDPAASVDDRIWLDASNVVDYAAALGLLTSGPIGLDDVVELSDILSEEVVALIQNSPGSPLLRGLIRAQTNKAPPPDVMSGGTEAITKWVLDTVKEAQPVGDSVIDLGGTAEEAPPPPAAPVPRVAPVATRPVNFTYVERETGVCDYTVTNTYSGPIQVPVTVIEEGEEEVEAYIRNRYSEMRSTSSAYNYEDHNCDNTECDEFTSNADEVCSEYEEEENA